MSIIELEGRELELEPPGGGLWREAIRGWFAAQARSSASFLVGVSRLRGDLRAAAGARTARSSRTSRWSRTGVARGHRASTYSGVDDLGRDELSRLIYGARYSLLIGVVAVTVGLSFGLLLGACAGYFRRTDGLIMRVMDVMLAIPGFLMAIGIVALFGAGGLCR